MGAVFGVIATFKNESSAYVPAISYACDVLNWDTDCNGPSKTSFFLICLQSSNDLSCFSYVALEVYVCVLSFLWILFVFLWS